MNYYYDNAATAESWDPQYRHRWMEEEQLDTSNIQSSDWETLRNALIVYLPAAVAVYLVFCWVRRRFPAVYNARNYTADPSARCPLAAEPPQGFFDWTWRVLRLPEDELVEQCGVDAVCLLRILRLGFKVSLGGCFCAIFLVPTYVTAAGTDEEDSEDKWVRTTIAHVPEGNRNRFLAAALAAYFLFGQIMYLILQEFRWFIGVRTKFLANPLPRTYSIYVTGIPLPYRSDKALAGFFSRVLSEDSVLQASVALNIPKLTAKVALRHNLIQKLKHARAQRDLGVSGLLPLQGKDGEDNVPMTTVTTLPTLTGKRGSTIMERVPAIPYFKEQLAAVQVEIAELREVVAAKKVVTERATRTAIKASFVLSAESSTKMSSAMTTTTPLWQTELSGIQELSDFLDESEEDEEEDDDDDAVAEEPSAHSDAGGLKQQQSDHGDDEKEPTKSDACNNKSEADDSETYHDATEGSSFVPGEVDRDEVHQQRSSQQDEIEHILTKSASVESLGDDDFDRSPESEKKRGLRKFMSDRSGEVKQMEKFVWKRAKEVKKLEKVVVKATEIIGLGSKDDEGKPFDAGFVTFTKLSAVNAALQIIHSTIPDKMNATEAPNHETVIWPNVGLTPHQVQVGWLLAAGITTALIIFWTVPVAFIVSWTEVSNLEKTFPFLKDWLEAAPWLEALLKQIAPLTLTLLNSVVLSVILRKVSRLEGVIGLSYLESAVYTKLASFQLVQTFFVASLTGSITSALSALTQVSDIFKYLAETLPPQAVFFIQLLFIDTVIGVGTEILRATALVHSKLRKFLGPRLTDEEKNSVWIGIRPLTNPRYFLFAIVLAKITLFFMILLTYATLAPFTCFVSAFCFIVTEIAYRHQMVYVYPVLDSGGQLWFQFMTILLGCVVIAEGILMTYFGSSKARNAFIMMIPLVSITAIFIVYLLRRHFHVAGRLSSENCVRYDVRNNLSGSRAKELLGDKYVQPELLADMRDDEVLDEPDDEETAAAPKHTSDEEVVDEPNDEETAVAPKDTHGSS